MILLAFIAASALAQSPLIPRELLLGNPERTSPRLSPDGKQLSWLAPDLKGVLQVWVRPLNADDKDAAAVTRDPVRPAAQFPISHRLRHGPIGDRVGI